MTTNRAELVGQLLGALGLSPGELVAGQQVPTLGDYLPKVKAASGEGAKKTYAAYWQRLADSPLASLRLTDVKTTDLEALARTVEAEALRRSNSRDGRSAREHFVAATRVVFQAAANDGYITSSPAAPGKLDKPRRLPSGRRAFTDDELAELYQVTSSGGDDPILDTLLLRFHLETGARRGGALGLRLRDIDTRKQCVRLREKGGTRRWQPISKTLLDALVTHAEVRGAVDPNDPLFRRKPRRDGEVGVPISRRRYNTLVNRWRRELPWVEEHGVSIHWCRHHATSSIERIAGYAVARAFAGHAEGEEVTTTYIKASEREVAQALAVYTGEPHPLAGS